MTYLFQDPAKIGIKCQIKRLKKGGNYFYTQTFDYSMNSAELLAHSVLSFLICNCICNRLISLFHKLFMKYG